MKTKYLCLVFAVLGAVLVGLGIGVAIEGDTTIRLPFQCAGIGGMLALTVVDLISFAKEK